MQINLYDIYKSRQKKYAFCYRTRLVKKKKVVLFNKHCSLGRAWSVKHFWKAAVRTWACNGHAWKHWSFLLAAIALSNLFPQLLKTQYINQTLVLTNCAERQKTCPASTLVFIAHQTADEPYWGLGADVPPLSQVKWELLTSTSCHFWSNLYSRSIKKDKNCFWSLNGRVGLEVLNRV